MIYFWPRIAWPADYANCWTSRHSWIGDRLRVNVPPHIGDGFLFNSVQSLESGRTSPLRQLAYAHIQLGVHQIQHVAQHALISEVYWGSVINSQMVFPPIVSLANPRSVVTSSAAA